MPNTGDQPEKREGVNRDEFVDELHAEVLEEIRNDGGIISVGLPVISALVAGGKFGYEVYKGSAAIPDPEKPLLVSVAATRTLRKTHDFIVEIKNLGLHGVYLEELSIKKPDVAVRALGRADHKREWWQWVTRDDSMSDSKARPSYTLDERTLPALMPPNKASSLDLIVRIERFGQERLEEKPYGEFELEYVVAGVAETDLSETFGFSVRREEEEEKIEEAFAPVVSKLTSSGVRDHLRVKDNSKGEGTFVYASANPYTGQPKIAWLVVHSEVYPLHEAAKDLTPSRPLPRIAPEEVWSRANWDPYRITEAIEYVFGPQ